MPHLDQRRDFARGEDAVDWASTGQCLGIGDVCKLSLVGCLIIWYGVEPSCVLGPASLVTCVYSDRNPGIDDVSQTGSTLSLRILPGEK